MECLVLLPLLKTIRDYNRLVSIVEERLKGLGITVLSNEPSFLVNKDKIWQMRKSINNKPLHFVNGLYITIFYLEWSIMTWDNHLCHIENSCYAFICLINIIISK